MRLAATIVLGLVLVSTFGVLVIKSALKVERFVAADFESLKMSQAAATTSKQFIPNQATDIEVAYRGYRPRLYVRYSINGDLVTEFERGLKIPDNPSRVFWDYHGEVLLLEAGWTVFELKNPPLPFQVINVGIRTEPREAVREVIINGF